MSGLTFLAKQNLLWLGLLAPLVALYVLRVKRARRRVASTWLWAAAKKDLLAKTPFKRLEPYLSLLFEALALTLLVLALARPSMRGRELVGDHVAIVIDASASMQAAAKGPDGELTTRLELARKAASELVVGLPPGSDVMVLEAGAEPRVVLPLERDMSRVRRHLELVKARDVEGDVSSSVALAIDRLRQLGGTSRVVLVTDGAFARDPALDGSTVPVDVVTVGDPLDNAAIVRVDVRSGRDPSTDQEQVQAFVMVASFAAAPRDVYVTMRQDNASDVLASRRVLVGPGEKVPVVLSFYPTKGDYRRGLVFELSPRDALPVDDVAFGRVPAGDKLPAVLVAPPGNERSPWLERALATDPDLELTVVKAGELSTTPVDADALVVVEGACPTAAAPGGDLLLVNPPAGPCLGTVVGATVEGPTITSWENGDPRLRFLTLDDVGIASARLLEPGSPKGELVRSDKGVLVADVSTATRTITVVGFDVGESDWPLKASYVLFMRNVAELARAHRALGVAGPMRAGAPLRVAVPPSATDLEVLGPGDEPGATKKLDASLRAGLAVVPEASRVGLYRVTWKGPAAGSLVVPVNLTSAAESDLRPKPVGAGAKGEVNVAKAGDARPALAEWGWVLALAALVFVLLDVWWLTRAPTRARSAALPVAPERRKREPAGPRLASGSRG